jgi:hypothetical protein
MEKKSKLPNKVLQPWREINSSPTGILLPYLLCHPVTLAGLAHHLKPARASENTYKI